MSPSSFPKNEIIAIGATLLRISVQWNWLGRIGMSNKDALLEMRQLFPNLHQALLEELERNPLNNDNLTPITLNLEELQEGMVLFEDIMTRDDSRLLRRGQRLSAVALEKLLNHYGNLLSTDVVTVCATSCPVDMANLVAATAPE